MPAKLKESITLEVVPLVERMTALQCTYEDMAYALDVPLGTLQAWLRTPECEAALERGRKLMVASLERMYWRACAKGAAACLIFAMKNLKGWRDIKTIEVRDLRPALKRIVALPDDELARLAQTGRLEIEVGEDDDGDD